MRRSILNLLDQVRAIAQTGLHYARDPYDRDRYQRLFDLAAEEYSDLTQIDVAQIKAQFLKTIGAVSPLSAASGAIFSDEGQILLIRRADDGKLAVPGGLCEFGESPGETAVREVREETGLEVEVRQLIDVFCGRSGTYNRVVTVHSTMYWCSVLSGDFGPTLEATEVGFYDHLTVPDDEWHREYKFRVQRAHDFWVEHVRGT